MLARVESIITVGHGLLRAMQATSAPSRHPALMQPGYCRCDVGELLLIVTLLFVLVSSIGFAGIASGQNRSHRAPIVLQRDDAAGCARGPFAQQPADAAVLWRANAASAGHDTGCRD